LFANQVYINPATGRALGMSARRTHTQKEQIPAPS